MEEKLFKPVAHSDERLTLYLRRALELSNPDLNPVHGLLVRHVPKTFLDLRHALAHFAPRYGAGLDFIAEGVFKSGHSIMDLL